jgi:hypothetical protein
MIFVLPTSWSACECSHHCFEFASLRPLMRGAATAFTAAAYVHLALPACASERLCSALIAPPRYLLRFLRFYAANLEAVTNVV